MSFLQLLYALKSNKKEIVILIFNFQFKIYWLFKKVQASIAFAGGGTFNYPNSPTVFYPNSTNNSVIFAQQNSQKVNFQPDYSSPINQNQNTLSNYGSNTVSAINHIY